jgi:hypothetical protein
MNDTNPSAPPVPVEEDDPGYDLQRIARLYNRLGLVLKWIVQLLVIEIPIIAGIIILDLLIPNTGIFSDVVRFFLGLGSCVVFLAHFTLIVLCFYGIAVIVFIAFALKYRAPAMLLMILGATSFPINILVMVLLRRRAKQILREAGVEIINGKVDLAQIPVEEDYEYDGTTR